MAGTTSSTSLLIIVIVAAGGAGCVDATPPRPRPRPLPRYEAGYDEAGREADAPRARALNTVGYKK